MRICSRAWACFVHKVVEVTVAATTEVYHLIRVSQIYLTGTSGALGKMCTVALEFSVGAFGS